MAKKTKKTVKKTSTKKAAPKKAVAKKAAPKKAAKKTTAAAKKTAPSKEVLFVASKVKAYIKQSDKMTASETLEALNDKIYALLDAAIARTEGNGRKTVKPQDL
jgi:histone H3/H4